jgi:GGDEF domain-containing protein
MPEDNSLQTLHATVHCYLSTLQAVADAVAQACPPVGGPYRQRLGRLRARLAFDSSSGAIEESCEAAARELQEFAGKASGYVERHRGELLRAIAGLEDIAHTLAERQDHYGERLREFARQMEPSSAVGSGMLSCVESMSQESHSLLKRMRDEMVRMETRLAEAEVTDPVTGLMNRSEMERCIEAVEARGEKPVLLLFEFRDPLPVEVAQQVSGRLESQFRHNDLVARWSAREFLVLFHGSAETARMRATQVAPWIAGRYLLDTGETVETVVEAVVEPRVAEATLSDPEPAQVG